MKSNINYHLELKMTNREKAQKALANYEQYTQLHNMPEYVALQEMAVSVRVLAKRLEAVVDALDTALKQDEKAKAPKAEARPLTEVETAIIEGRLDISVPNEVVVSTYNYGDLGTLNNPNRTVRKALKKLYKYDELLRMHTEHKLPIHSKEVYKNRLIHAKRVVSRALTYVNPHRV